MLHYGAMFNHVKPISKRSGEPKILLDHDHRITLGPQRGDHARQRLHNHRRKAFGNFVEQQQLGTRAQDARHGQHLLLAAGQLLRRSARLGNMS